MLNACRAAHVKRLSDLHVKHLCRVAHVKRLCRAAHVKRLSDPHVRPPRTITHVNQSMQATPLQSGDILSVIIYLWLTTPAVNYLSRDISYLYNFVTKRWL